MLCPKCRRQVGKDGYCPEGHLARPERAPQPEPYQLRTQAPPEWQQPSRFDIPAPEVTPPPAAIPPEPGTPRAPKPKRRPIIPAILIGLFVIAVFGYMVLGPTASAANLKFAYTKGETHTYNLTMTFNINATSVQYGALSFNGSMATTLIQRTLSVEKNGVATLTYELGKIRFTQRSSTVNVPAQGVILRVRVAPDGAVLDAEGKGLLAFAESDPMADFANISGPESFGPILPDHKVDPGQSWSINQDMANPFGDTIHFRGQATLTERRTIGNEEVAVIRSVMNMPFNIDASFADMAKYAGEAPPPEFRRARMIFNGFLSGDLTQSLATKSGFLKSTLGTIKMTGTLGFKGIPEIENFEAVLNGGVELTMTEVV